ncbi:MAG: transcriptional regulator, GntR family [Clostridiales bacterium]|jgi:DNA-binding transcriptional regulator YhcF (GntR family)|nr:transcriptional regulator, GntR family [Clostridiales bacterium]
MMNLNIDKNLNISIYIQIVNQIIEAIDMGIFKPGERLPTQREISAGFNISRGTIQKAYEELEKRGVVEILKGSGSFVSKVHEPKGGERKEIAVKLIDELLDKLSNINYTYSEISAFIEMRMSYRENKDKCVSIAAIDCNPEALEIFKIQFSIMKNIQFRIFILDDILKYSQPDKVFEDYDIIITTLNHYDEVSGILYSHREKLFKAAVSPASDTIINIATIPENSEIGIISESVKFKDIMFRNLETFNIEKEKVEHAFNTDTNLIKRFLRNKNFLIIPQSYRLENAFLKKDLQGFLKKAGKIIEFKYQIERGSLIYIEEQIDSILDSR